MAILSNVFGDDQQSDSSNDLLGAVGVDASIDASSETTNTSTDEDGSSESSTSSQDLGTDLSSDGILSGMNDTLSSSDNDSGGLLG